PKTGKHDRDIVLSAAVISFRNQFATGNREICFVGEDILNILGAKLSRQTITTKQQHVIAPEPDASSYRRDFALSTEGLKNHVAEHMCFGFRLADLADIDELLDQRLILSS